MRVFVAGATGVLGTAAVRRLVTSGHQVTGIGRSPRKSRILRELGARAVEADLFDAAAMRKAVEGHDVVCNLATRIPVGPAMVRGASWRENDHIRADGSAILAKAAADCGSLRLIQEAVALVYADAGENWITEQSPVAPVPMTQSSLTATQNAMSFADQYRFAVVLRFGQFYGDDANTRWQIDRVRKGKATLLGDPEGFVSPITIDDAAAAVVAALAAPTGIYNVAGEPVRRSEWGRALATAAGTDASARYVTGLARKFLGARADVPARSLRISSDAFYAATGWRARTDLAEGFAPAAKEMR